MYTARSTGRSNRWCQGTDASTAGVGRGISVGAATFFRGKQCARQTLAVVSVQRQLVQLAWTGKGTPRFRPRGTSIRPGRNGCRHRAAFVDKADDDGVFPRTYSDKDPAAVQETFQDFYATADRDLGLILSALLQRAVEHLPEGASGSLFHEQDVTASENEAPCRILRSADRLGELQRSRRLSATTCLCIGICSRLKTTQSISASMCRFGLLIQFVTPRFIAA